MRFAGTRWQVLAKPAQRPQIAHDEQADRVTELIYSLAGLTEVSELMRQV